MYDVQFGEFARLRRGDAELVRRETFKILRVVHGKRMRDGLNEPREDFIGTRVGQTYTRSNGD